MNLAEQAVLVVGLIYIFYALVGFIVWFFTKGE